MEKHLQYFKHCKAGESVRTAVRDIPPCRAGRGLLSSQFLFSSPPTQVFNQNDEKTFQMEIGIDKIFIHFFLFTLVIYSKNK